MLCMRTAPSNEESLRFCDSLVAESDAAHEIARSVVTRDRADPEVDVLELCRFSISNREYGEIAVMDV